MRVKIACLSLLFFSSPILLFSKELAFKSGSDYLSIAREMKQKGDMEKAIDYYKMALEVNPDNLIASRDLAFIYYRQKRYDESLDYFQKVLSLSKDNIAVLSNIGHILFRKKCMIGKAVEIYKKIVELDPKNMRAHGMLCDGYLKLGEFEKAFEKRKFLDKSGVDHEVNQMEKVWQGEDLNGKTILIHDNIGIGDMFLWIRYASMFKERGAKVIVQVRKFLIPILASCSSIDQLISKEDIVPYFDFQAGVGQLHHRINKTIDDIYKFGFNIPYLKANQKLVQAWSYILGSDKNFKIGLCWDASQYFNRSTGEKVVNPRSMPLSEFYPLSKLKNVTLYSLQKANGIEQLNDLPSDFVVNTLGDDFDKKYGAFMDTAAVMKNLDLVITIDTSVAHLAGALGIPVWLVVPYVSDWRWFLNKQDSPWYPTMKIFRQKKLDDWGSAVIDIVSQFSGLIDNRDCEAKEEENGGIEDRIKSNTKSYMKYVLRELL